MGGETENVDDQTEEKENKEAKTPQRAGVAAALSALGIVFGDIGTSPLYTMKTVLSDTGEHVDRATTLGILSLLVWTLVIITTLKYVSVAMRIDNDGEGGILALMSLIGVKRGNRPAVIAAGLFGAALIYGDGTITPAISVLSALEGLHLAVPAIDPYILPLAVVVLLALFAVQPLGTGSIGKVFGPIMLLWFVVIALLGVLGIVHHPDVLVGLSPTYGLAYLAHGGFKAFALLGSVFLCVTGAEALYADMGHFGTRPIQVAWYGAVFPALVLNYAGQAAIVLNGAPTTDNIFYRLCPPALIVPLIVLATLATIIASQSIITGAFSMTRQAIQLGWLPRLLIKQTSEEGYGQIYVGAVNWLLMLVTIALTLGFQKSDHLASAYGIAVSTTMLVTSGLLFIALREIKGWSLIAAGAAAAGFFAVDVAFFTSNLLKVADGGWIPLVLAAVVFGLMRVWHAGVTAAAARVGASPEPIDAFFARIAKEEVFRPRGTAIFLSRTREATPPLIVWSVEKNRCLYEDVVILSRVTALVPRVTEAEKYTATKEAPNVWRVQIRTGFMERLDLADVLPVLRDIGCHARPDQAIFYVGRETVLRTHGVQRLSSRFVIRLFALMERNQAHLTDVLGLPSDRVVEIGRFVEL